MFSVSCKDFCFGNIEYSFNDKNWVTFNVFNHNIPFSMPSSHKLIVATFKSFQVESFELSIKKSVFLMKIKCVGVGW